MYIPDNAVKVNKKPFGTNDNNIWIVRDQKKQPLVDLLAIDPSKGETCPNDYVQLDTMLQKWFICVKRRSAAVAEGDQDGQVVTAALRHRVPALDHPDHDLDDRGLAALCFPRGIIITTSPQPEAYMSFVITRPDGSEVYATSLTIYEKVPLKMLEFDTNFKDLCKQAQSAAALTQQQYQSRAGTDIGGYHLYFPTSLTILSRWPFYSSFRSILSELSRLSTRVKIEPYLRTLLLQTQLPRPGLRTVSLFFKSTSGCF